MRRNLLSVITLTAFTMVPQQASASGLTKDFINGFETGIFERDDENAFHDYSCNKPTSDSKLKNQAQQIIAPMKMMQAFTKDAKLTAMADTIELFANSAAELEVVFAG